jgi:hypothetical protein
MTEEVDEGINNSRMHTSMRSKGIIDRSFTSNQADVISEVDKQTE